MGSSVLYTFWRISLWVLPREVEDIEEWVWRWITGFTLTIHIRSILWICFTNTSWLTLTLCSGSCHHISKFSEYFASDWWNFNRIVLKRAKFQNPASATYWTVTLRPSLPHLKYGIKWGLNEIIYVMV